MGIILTLIILSTTLQALALIKIMNWTLGLSELTSLIILIAVMFNITVYSCHTYKANFYGLLYDQKHKTSYSSY